MVITNYDYFNISGVITGVTNININIIKINE